MTIRTSALIASTALALVAAPLLADTTQYTFDPANTLAGNVDTLTVIGDTVGDTIVTRDGVLLGTIETFDIVENNRAAVQIDLEADLLFQGDTMDLTIDPANVTVLDGAVALNATEEELYAARGPVGGSVKVNF